MRLPFLSFIVFFQSACSIVGIQREESPSYEVIVKDQKKEIRLYKPYLVAKTQTTGAYKQAQTEAFQILAGYIFGDNNKKEKMAMTSPVTQGSEKINMTSPVIQEQENGRWRMQFMMPSTYTLEDLPTPNNPNISFEMIPSHYVASIAYSWNTSVKKNKKKYTELLKWLDTQSKFSALPSPKFAGYNPPWTIPFLKRNELWVTLEKNNFK